MNASAAFPVISQFSASGLFSVEQHGDNCCPLKPGIKCRISARLASPCICPKIQSFLDHADRFDQRRDALGTSPDQTTPEDRPHGIPIPTCGAGSSDLPLPMREPAFEPADLLTEGYF